MNTEGKDNFRVISTEATQERSGEIFYVTPSKDSSASL
jgi:hypothetical protein